MSPSTQLYNFCSFFYMKNVVKLGTPEFSVIFFMKIVLLKTKVFFYLEFL